MHAEQNAMDESGFTVTPLAPNCGAMIGEIDLAGELSDAAVEALHRTLTEHCVIFFRDQQITPEQHKRFGERFGELHRHPAWPRLVDGHPEIMEIHTDADSTRTAGEAWHSDVSCDAEPPLGTVLYMLQVPPSGGDTLFANMYAAYDALSPPIQRTLEGMTAVHDGEQVYRGRYGVDDAGKTFPRSEHPVIRTHPVSGRKALFVNRTFTTRIVQLQPAESDAILGMLFQHLERPDWQCRFQWQPGSIAFWDNRCAQHLALWDYYPNTRTGHRVTIKGDAPR